MIITYTDVPGAPANPQSIGQFKVVVKDVKIVSEAANDAGDFVVIPSQIGLNHIFGVVDLHAYGGAAADIPRLVDFVPSTNTVTYTGTDRGALDLDATDFSQARLAFWGD